MSVTPQNIHATPLSQPVLRQARDLWQSGKLIVFPTETVYGIGCAATNDVGWHALEAFHPGAAEKNFTLHLGDIEHACQWMSFQSPILKRFLQKLWPGPVTIELPLKDHHLDALRQYVPQGSMLEKQLLRQRILSLRVPAHDVVRQLLRTLNQPVAATGIAVQDASQMVPACDAQMAQKAAADAAEIIIDAGPCRFSKPSTTIRVQVIHGWPQWTMVRQGVYDDRTMRKLTRWNLLLVCTGNTCRSPMAQGLAQSLLAQRLGLAPDDLPAAGIHISSAGVFASNGVPASTQAVEALATMQVDISKHRSRGLSLQMLEEADVIYCMTRSHQHALLQMLETKPQSENKVLLLDPQKDIQDPIGGSTQDYIRCARQIQQALETRLQEWQS